MIPVSKRRFKLLTLLALLGAGFSLFTSPGIFSAKVCAAKKETLTQKKKSESVKKSEARSKKKAESDTEDETMFLKDSEKAIDYLPEIYRCPECGYEQDFSGTCPDHSTLALIKILSRGRDPLEPAELDGNEDIIVDIPLKNLQFRKDTGTATPTKDLN